jgi:FkbM family methyltransferase
MKTKKFQTAQGFTLEGYEGDFIPRVIQDAGYWECGLTLLMSHYIKKGDVVLDLGANLGYDSILASYLVGTSGHVYSFEPVPNTYSILIKNIESNECDNITAFNYAAFNDHSTLYISGDAGKFGPDDEHNFTRVNTGGISLEQSSKKITNDYQIKLKSVILDELFPTDTRFDFIKMDIEGAEPCAFEGMQIILAQNPNVAIVMEYTPYNKLFESCQMNMIKYFKANDYIPYIPVCVDVDDTIEKRESLTVTAKLHMLELTWKHINEAENQIEAVAFIKNSVRISDSTSTYEIGNLHQGKFEDMFDKSEVYDSYEHYYYT